MPISAATGAYWLTHLITGELRIDSKQNMDYLALRRVENRFIEGNGGTYYVSQLRIGTILPGISTIARRQDDGGRDALVLEP